MIGPLVFMIVTGGQLLNQSRPMLVSSITNGNSKLTATLLSRYAAFGGVAEFILNPIIGRMSDRFGRRPLLMLSPVGCAVLRGLVFAFPGSTTMIMMERMLSSAVVTGFFSTMRAMLNDTLKMEDLVVAGGAISVCRFSPRVAFCAPTPSMMLSNATSTYTSCHRHRCLPCNAADAGIGVMIGPFAETFVLERFGASGNFLAVALINVVVALVMFRTARETLSVADRKPLTLKDCSPLSFLQIFRTGSVNNRLLFILLLQSFGEGRINQDINMLNLRENLGWRPIQISTFMGLLGLTVTTGGKTVKPSLRILGMRGHTCMSNLIMALAFFIQGTQSKYLSQYLALSLWFFGGRKRDAVEAMSTDILLKNTDMGKGQIAAALSNFKSLAAIAGPPFAAQAYIYGRGIGNPGLPYWIIAGLHLIAEGVHQTLSNKRLGVTGFFGPSLAAAAAAQKKPPPPPPSQTGGGTTKAE